MSAPLPEKWKGLAADLRDDSTHVKRVDEVGRDRHQALIDAAAALDKAAELAAAAEACRDTFFAMSLSPRLLGLLRSSKNASTWAAIFASSFCRHRRGLRAPSPEADAPHVVPGYVASASRGGLPCLRSSWCPTTR